MRSDTRTIFIVKNSFLEVVSLSSRNYLGTSMFSKFFAANGKTGCAGWTGSRKAKMFFLSVPCQNFYDDVKYG